MTRSLNLLLRGVFLAAAAQMALFHAPLAGAASITISNDACESFALGGTGGNQTLMCVSGTSSVPVCSVTGASSAVVNSSITLVASCTGSPTSYAWSGGSCEGGSGATCSATSSSTGSVAYSVTAANGNGTGNPSAAKSVNWTTTAVPVCTLSASPSTVPAGGGTVTFTASCSGSPSSYTWGSPNELAFIANANVSSQAAQAMPGATVTVTGTNGGGSGSPASVTVGLSSGGSSGSVAISSCPGYTAAQTKVMDVTIPASGFTKYVVTTAGIFRDGKSTGFYPNDVMVVVFKAPPADPAWQVNFVQTGDGGFGPAASRTITLSTKPCDFQYPKGPDALWSGEMPNLSLTLASGTTPSAYSRYLLVPGQEYYINIRNKTSNGGGCESTRCDISFATANNKP